MRSRRNRPPHDTGAYSGTDHSVRSPVTQTHFATTQTLENLARAVRCCHAQYETYQRLYRELDLTADTLTLLESLPALSRVEYRNLSTDVRISRDVSGLPLRRSRPFLVSHRIARHHRDAQGGFLQRDRRPQRQKRSSLQGVRRGSAKLFLPFQLPALGILWWGKEMPTAVVFAKFMCATLSILRTGCMAQSGRAAGGIAAAKLALSGANPT